MVRNSSCFLSWTFLYVLNDVKLLGKMSKLVGGLPEWANLLLKVLLIMIFPMNVMVSDLYQLINLPTSGLLFTPIDYNPFFLTNITQLGLLLGGVLRNFSLGILVAFPGMYYNYKLSRAPVNKSYWKRGIGVAIAIFFLTLGVMMISQFVYMTSPFSNFYVIYTRIMLYPTLVIGVFIILPLVLRQAVIIGSPSYLHHFSIRELESNPKFKISREKMLSTIFWIFLCFAPFVILINIWGWISQYTYSGLLMNYQLYPFSILGSIIDIASLMLFALMGVFHFAFVRDTYRYLRKTITYKKLIFTGVLSIIFPIILATGLFPIVMYYMIVIPIPIPLLQFAGLLMVRYHRPIVDQVDRVWTGDESKMWWEKDMWWEKEERPARKQYTEHTPEKPHRHRNEIITVPMRYLLLSRIRRLKQRIRG